eukprot:4513840-Pleurochrysis_carterae.AAC.1
MSRSTVEAILRLGCLSPPRMSHGQRTWRRTDANASTAVHALVRPKQHANQAHGRTRTCTSKRARTHPHAHARTRTRATHARARTRTHAHARARTRTHTHTHWRAPLRGTARRPSARRSAR